MGNKAHVREFIEEVWNLKHFHLIDDYISPAFLPHGFPSNVPATREGFSQLAQAFHQAFPDLHFTIEDIFEESGNVVVRWDSTATHKGTLLGVAATNKPVKRNGITIYRVEDLKIVEWWNASDMLPVLVQIGVIKLPLS